MSTVDPALLKNIFKKSGVPEPRDVNISFDEIDSFGNEESVRGLMRGLADYSKMLNERITFISPQLSRIVPFTRENLYLICAYTGSGKSTIAANVSYSLWKEQKKTLVISNEESAQDVIMRIACIDVGVAFNDYKKGNMPGSIKRECAIKFKEITQYVKVIDVSYRDGLTTSVEGVKNMLEEVNHKDYSCVMIDYWQLIKKSNANPHAKSYDVLNDLRIWLGQYIKRANIPVVLFAQLHSYAKRQNKDLDSRIKMCPDILEPSTVVIEAVPDWENKCTELIIHKDRFGMAGAKLVLAFDKGRFVDMDQEALKKIQEMKVAELDEKIGESESKDV